jgi:hypothetical protein
MVKDRVMVKVKDRVKVKDKVRVRVRVKVKVMGFYNAGKKKYINKKRDMGRLIEKSKRQWLLSVCHYNNAIN